VVYSRDNQEYAMQLNFNECNTIALLLERTKPRYGITTSEQAILFRIREFMKQHYQGRQFKTGTDYAKDNLEEQKDQNEDRDGTYR
jgi:hypothetical protein